MRNIIIHNDLDRKFLELTEDELIIKKFLYKKRVKRSNIRSAYMDEESLNILTYDNKIGTVFISAAKWSEREYIKRIIAEVNKEDIIFNFGGRVMPTWAITFYSMVLLSNVVINVRFESVFIRALFLIFIFICLSIMYLENEKYNHIRYYINDKKLQWKSIKNRSDKGCLISDIELVKCNDIATKYKVKSSKYTFYIINKINYPLSYKFALEEIRNITKEKDSIKK